MSITLFGAPLSPFVRKVRICMQEKQLGYELEVIMPFDVPDWYKDISPLGRIPGFRDETGFSLADSSVICQYLDEAYSNTLNLMGNNAQERAKIRWFEKYADYELAPHTTFTVFVNRILKPVRGETPDEQSIQRAITEKLPPHFDYLDQQLGTQNYLVGNQLSLADIALISQLITFEYAGEVVDGARWPSLEAYFQRLKSRPSIHEVVQTERAGLEKLLNSR